MEIKRFNQINKGNWSISKDKKDYENFIRDIIKLREKYEQIGDDELYNAFDNAIERLEEMKKLAK